MSGTDAKTPKKEKRDWTLMFYFASDNPLAPTIVSQLKAIKQAGHDPDVNVIMHFDPRTVGTPTHVFDVNILNKLKRRLHSTPNNPEPTVNFSNDPYVRNLIEDKLWGNETFEPEAAQTNGVSGARVSGAASGSQLRVKVRERLKEVLAGLKYDPPPFPSPPESSNGAGKKGAGQTDPSAEPVNSFEPDPKDALQRFLTFCQKQYPARHYILFILGHGLAVGDDVFLYDEHAGRPSLTLTQFRNELRTFSKKVQAAGDRFELLSFHSCSVSSLEVAFELAGTANYMLATQSPAFVGSWPYQQIVTRIIKDQRRSDRRGGAAEDEAAVEKRIKRLVGKIFDYCYYNSTDFLLAGYSFALTLCDLRGVREVIKEPVNQLTDALREALTQKTVSGKTLLKDLIQLAHLRSQSYWHETYTDLFDFCLCLARLCEEYKAAADGLDGPMTALREACLRVMRKLSDESKKNRSAKGDELQLAMRCAYAGPAYQYSHGLSVFFPWTEPSTDNALWWKVTRSGGREPGEYKNYAFSQQTGWDDFLEAYFKETMRDTRGSEDRERDIPAPKLNEADQLAEVMASLVYNEEGQLSADSILKTNPRDGVGDDCNCPTIKNFPRDTRARPERRGHAASFDSGKIPLNPGRR